MAKRFTDTNKYKKPFIRGLQGAYKLFWDYLYHECDHAGIWIVDFEIAQIYLGSDMQVNKSDALKFFNKNELRIIEINNGSKWFLPSFIDFQYNELSEANRAHNSVIKILNKYNLIDNKGLIRGLQAHKDKDKEKDKDKDKENYIILFEKIDSELKIAEEFKEQILIWLKYKSEKNQSYKETGLKTLIKSIIKDHKNIDSLKKCIEYSMKNNYSGLFNENNKTKTHIPHDTDF